MAMLGKSICQLHKIGFAEEEKTFYLFVLYKIECVWILKGHTRPDWTKPKLNDQALGMMNEKEWENNNRWVWDLVPGYLNSSVNT